MGEMVSGLIFKFLSIAALLVAVAILFDLLRIRGEMLELIF
jgi:hypothetical protein